MFARLPGFRRLPARPADDGFTLIETIVALAVFAGVFAVLYGGLAGNWRGVRRAQMDAVAMVLAQAEFARAGTETALADGQSWSGEHGGVYWTVTVEAYRAPTSEARQSRLTAYWISFDGRWSDGPGRQPKSFLLRTLKLGDAR